VTLGRFPLGSERLPDGTLMLTSGGRDRLPEEPVMLRKEMLPPDGVLMVGVEKLPPDGRLMLGKEKVPPDGRLTGETDNPSDGTLVVRSEMLPGVGRVMLEKLPLGRLAVGKLRLPGLWKLMLGNEVVGSVI
jgi:hypothetical protein